MGLMESLKSAFSLILDAMPNEDPIKKQALLLPDNLTSFNLAASDSEERSLPSGVSMQNHEPFGFLFE